MAHVFWDTMRRFDGEKSRLSRRNALAAAAMQQLSAEGRRAIDESRELIRKVEDILARNDPQPKRV